MFYFILLMESFPGFFNFYFFLNICSFCSCQMNFFFLLSLDYLLKTISLPKSLITVEGSRIFFYDHQAHEGFIKSNVIIFMLSVERCRKRSVSEDMHFRKLLISSKNTQISVRESFSRIFPALYVNKI